MNSQTEVPSYTGSRRFVIADYSMLLVVAIWGANSSIVKLALFQIQPLAFTAFRFAIASIFLAFILLLREGSIGLPSCHIWKVIGLGVIGNTLYQVLFIMGLSMTSASNCALIIATTPAIVTLIGACLGIERTSWQIIFGIILAFLGVSLIISAHGVALRRGTLEGDLLILGSVVCWSIYTLGVRSLSRHISSLRVTVLTILVGTPGLVILSAPWLVHTEWRHVSPSAWGGLAYTAILTLVVGYVLWNNSVHRIGGGRTSIYTCATPVVATIIAWLLLNERPSPLQAIGTVLIICGVLLTMFRGQLSLPSSSDQEESQGGDASNSQTPPRLSAQLPICGCE